MASAAYHAPQRSQRRSARPYNPDEVIAYAEQHGTAQAAQRFGIDERSVRRIRQKAEVKVEPVTPGQDMMNTSDHIATVDVAPSTVFPDTADDRAGDSTYWKCPATGELMPVVPGTHRKDWERERQAAHARHLESLIHGSDTYVKERTPDTGQDTAEADMSIGPDIPNIALESDETAGHVRESAVPVSPDLSGPVRPIIVRERVVVRVPVEQPKASIREWVEEHKGLVNMMAAVLITMVLIGVANLG